MTEMKGFFLNVKCEYGGKIKKNIKKDIKNLFQNNDFFSSYLVNF